VATLECQAVDREGLSVVSALVQPRVEELCGALRRLRRKLDEGGDAGDAAAAVHKVRVAARRTGVTLGVVRASADAGVWRRLRRAVRRIRQVTGVIRDADVHLGLLRSLAGVQAAGEEVAFVIRAIEESRGGAVEELRGVVRRSGPRKLRALGRGLSGPADWAAGAAAGSLAGLAAQQIGQRTAQVLAFESAGLEGAERVHELRLAIKRLRYTLDLFSGCVADEVRTPAAALLEEAQRLAGDANDLVSLGARLDGLGDSLREAGDAERAGALASLRKRLGAVADLRQRRFTEWWAGRDVRGVLEPLARKPVAAVKAVPAVNDEPAEAGAMREATMARPGMNGAAASGVASGSPSQSNLWLAGSKLGVIDIGSNSIRLLAVELIDERSWTAIAEERAMTRLAHGLSESRTLSPEAMAQSVEAVGRFKAIAEKLGVTKVRAFATAAVREARNRDDFISLVQDRTGPKLELVSALDEGRLTHRSVARVFDLSHGTAAVMDIGGGSMEVVFSQNGVITENSSMPLGAVRLTERFGGADAASGPNYKKLRKHVEREVREHVRPHEKPPTVVVGCGGTCTTLVTLAAAARGVLIDRNSAALSTLGPVSLSQLRAILAGLRAMTLEQRLRVPGLPSDRADIVVAGLTAIERLLTFLGADSIAVHPGGFREGLVLRMIEQEVAERLRSSGDAPDPALVHAAREFAVRCGYERAHSEHVASLALSLFDQFRDESTLIPGLGTAPHERALLEAAAVLHDVGTMVEYRRHHKHTHTIIQHADLSGWSPRMTGLLALVGRYHRRAVPKPGHRAFAALPAADQALVTRLAAVLRVADGLDRSHRQAVREVRVRFGDRAVELSVRASSDAASDIAAAEGKADLLAGVLGCRVRVAASPEEARLPVAG
jgi:exopolyphosphatase/guanosine-5'-triphosphate,3'-diphosphate pyrophosphatase